MVDDNLADTATEKPLAQLASTERALDTGSPAGGDPVAVRPTSAEAAYAAALAEVEQSSKEI